MEMCHASDSHRDAAVAEAAVFAIAECVKSIDAADA
jgi:hypothetical protein